MRSWQKMEPGCEWEFHPRLNLYLLLHAVLPSFGIPHHLLKDVIIQTLITYGNRLLVIQFTRLDCDWNPDVNDIGPKRKWEHGVMRAEHRVLDNEERGK